MSQPQNLTILRNRKVAKEINKMEEYELDSQYKISHYPVFPQGKISELLEEFQRLMIYADENEIEIEDDNYLVSHILFLCIKHFTNMGRGISDKYEEQIVQLDELIDTGYFGQIANEVFMPSEINKVIDAMSNVLSTHQFIEKVNAKATQNLEDLEIRNKNMMNVLNSPLNEGDDTEK